jgi:hypothetical protein
MGLNTFDSTDFPTAFITSLSMIASINFVSYAFSLSEKL